MACHYMWRLNIKRVPGAGITRGAVCPAVGLKSVAHHSANLRGLNAEPVGPGAETVPRAVAPAPFASGLAVGNQIFPRLLVL